MCKDTQKHVSDVTVVLLVCLSVKRVRERGSVVKGNIKESGIKYQKDSTCISNLSTGSGPALMLACRGRESLTE